MCGIRVRPPILWAFIKGAGVRRILGWAGALWLMAAMAHADILTNTTVGTANGPEGATNVQTLATWENHPLHLLANPQADGHYWDPRWTTLTLELQNCGPGASTKCLAVKQNPDAVGTTAWDLAPYVYYTGDRQGQNVYIAEGYRANTYVMWSKGFSYPYTFDQRNNLEVPGFHKRRTPDTLTLNSSETDNLHYYSTFFQDFYTEEPVTATDPPPAETSPVWRKTTLGPLTRHQRGESGVWGYEMYNEITPGQYADQTRFYTHFRYDPNWDGGGGPPYTPDNDYRGTAYLDDLSYNYTNPFMAVWPPVSVQHVQVGTTARHDAIVYNTHPTKTRNFIFESSGRKRSNGVCFQTNFLVVKNLADVTVTETGDLAPGQGFRFYVEQDVPVMSTCPIPSSHPPIATGHRALTLLSIYEDPADVVDDEPWNHSPTQWSVANGRYNVPGVGFTAKTVLSTTPVVVPAAPAISDMTITGTGGSWIDVRWTSPATSTFYSEISDDPAVMAYQMRYSTSPITNEATWDAATPVETITPVFGPGNPQNFTVKGLAFNTQYYVAARTYNEDYVGGAMSFVTTTTLSADTDTGNGAPGGAPSNLAPSVNAGVDATVVLPAGATLTGVVNDDGLPNPPALTTVAWTQVSGSGTATFGNAALAQTTATFSEQGVYVLRLTANDSALNTSDDVLITVTDPPVAPGARASTGLKILREVP